MVIKKLFQRSDALINKYQTFDNWIRRIREIQAFVDKH